MNKIPAAGRTRLCVETVADLEVGDLLHLYDRTVQVHYLNPETRDAALAAGIREVHSGSWQDTFDSDWPVDAVPWEFLKEQAVTA
ncbi:hypothetical protein ACFXJ8_26330 [Nonomuraea sp. NPDC059194]|uniref:hypothetical protein n=1 Tax=Nonomuraea sp. NPDC059194 TaxID=3346764 RepID=UPI0036872119